ncbi:hypothetical protein GIB67_031277 [Kingdonia uniflora]|uniref:Uncharacterized protein n=1 Tax=Kingdonia uniflora TaxID=39325 RepID=A0A7J7P608_9MAGN|nr:hypothetical protein GIB67_031277 [Kingdonia uniflora]
MSTMMEELSSPMVNSSSNGSGGTPGKEQQAAVLLRLRALIMSLPRVTLFLRCCIYSWTLSLGVKLEKLCRN